MAYVQPINVKRQDVEHIVRATFPNYRGRKISVRASGAESLQDLNWSGGSRSEYRACTLDGRLLGTSADYNARWPGYNQGVEGARVDVPAGCVMVRHSILCGKDTGLTITCNAADMPRLLTTMA